MNQPSQQPNLKISLEVAESVVTQCEFCFEGFPEARPKVVELITGLSSGGSLTRAMQESANAEPNEILASFLESPRGRAYSSVIEATLNSALMPRLSAEELDKITQATIDQAIHTAQFRNERRSD